MLLILISQMNLLLSLVNDMLDIKLINEGKFSPKMQVFRPMDTLDFIKKMFESQMKMQSLSFTLLTDTKVVC